MVTLAGGDLIDVLMNQHQQIRNTLARVQAGPARSAALDELRLLLRAHEAGEQELVHPATRDFAGEGDIAGARMAEEQAADRALAELVDLGVDHDSFDERFAAFRDSVLRHAELEELEEFPRLRAVLTQERLVSMGGRLLAAEAQSGA
jgi:hemerythrin superfamily protein